MHRAAGASLFLPGEFGSDSSALEPSSFMYHKRAAIPHLEGLGLPYLQVFVGLFPDTTFLPGRFGFDLADGQATILGSGDEQVSGAGGPEWKTHPAFQADALPSYRSLLTSRQYSFTTCHDIGSFLGPLLTSTPPATLTTLHRISIQGERLSLNAAVALYEASHPGSKVAVTHRPVAEAQAEHDAIEGFSFRKLVLWLLLDWVKGAGDVTKGGEVGVANGLVEGWRPESVGEYLARQ